MFPTLKLSIPAAGVAGARCRPFLHSTAEPACSLARSGGRCHTRASAPGRRELLGPSDRAFPGELQISALLRFFLWTCQGRYASSLGMSTGKRQSAASLKASGRSAGYPSGGNVATDFITSVWTERD